MEYPGSDPGESAPAPARSPCGWSSPVPDLVLDIVYVLGIIAVFALIGLVAKGVEKL